MRSECRQGWFHTRPRLSACRCLSSRSHGLSSVSHKDISRVVWVPTQMTLSPRKSHSEYWGVRAATYESRGHDSAHQAPFLPSSHRPSILFPTSCLQLSSSHFLSLTCKASRTARRTMKAEKSKCPVSPFSPSINLLCDLNYLGCVACGTA